MKTDIASGPDFGKYDEKFFDSFSDVSYRAAQKILEELRGSVPFGSVVDFGCGSATWLKAAKEIVVANGDVPRLLGIDGSYAKSIVDPSVAEFLFSDLEQRIRLSERFDLAISLEVAEHLSPDRADSFVDDLCAASDAVLFSAAIPGQAGTNHINEQWQDYWHEIFSQKGYVAVDMFKQKFWNDPTFIECSYYVANSFLYVKQDHPLLLSTIRKIPKGHWSLRVAHPSLYVANHFDTASITKTLRSVPKKFWAAIFRRFRIGG